MTPHDQRQPETPTEICLRRIRQHDPTIHAWVAVDHSLVENGAVKPSDHDGGRKKPLADMPMGIKDIIDVAGFATRAGSTLTEQTIVAKDAPVVARLREAGAIILGKTVTTEFAYLDPPPTLNPWNLSRTPGGSSSGSAAAVAAEMCRAALGSQTGGSVLRPAAFCGVVGLKPTHGWCSVEGIVPLAPSLDHVGIFARSVADAELIYRAIAGTASPALPLQTATAPTLGILNEWFDAETSPDVKSVVSRAIGLLASQGATVVAVGLPGEFSAVHQNHLRLMAFEAAETHRTRYAAHREQMGPRIRELVELGRSVSVAEYDAAVQHREAFQAALQNVSFRHTGVLVMPSAPTTAPTQETTGSPRFNSPWSYSGGPAISIPCGVAEDGLPVGLQLVADKHCEAELLAAAAWCEAILQFRNHPPLS